MTHISEPSPVELLEINNNFDQSCPENGYEPRKKPLMISDLSDYCRPKGAVVKISKSNVGSQEVKLSEAKIIDLGDVDDAAKDAAVTDEDDKDGGYGWIVVFASFVNTSIVGVMFIGFSVLYIDFARHFKAEKGVTGWIGSIFLASGNILGIIFSVFVNNYGCRTVCIAGGITWACGFALSAFAPSISFLYFSYGLLGGVGFNTVTLTSFVIIQQHFRRRRPVAAGISSIGIAFGSLISGPLVGSLSAHFGWRGALLILSGIALNSCVFGALYRPDVKKKSGISVKNAKTEGLADKFRQIFRDMANVSLFRDMPFTMCCVGTFLMNIGLIILYQHTPSRAVVFGVPRSKAVLLPTIISTASVCARLFGGAVGNLPCTNRHLQYGICIILAGIMLVISASAQTFVPIALLGAVVGFMEACALSVQTTVLSDLVGVANVARAQAFALVFSGVGALIAVPLAGVIYDRTRNYNNSYYVGGIVQALGGVLIILPIIIKRVRRCL